MDSEFFSILLRHLARIRHFVLHFNLATDLFDRDISLACVKRLDDIIATQFAAIGPQPWFIPNAMGEAYIRRESESEPFVKEVYLPNCSLVGPFHDVRFENGAMVANDMHEYDDKEVTDAEFVALRRGGR